jgi:hypothetical protein
MRTIIIHKVHILIAFTINHLSIYYYIIYKIFQYT